jgi:hypothetical protein
MSVALAIQNRLLVCALILMLAPFGISTPTLVRAAQVEELPQVEVMRGDASVRVVRLDDLPQTVGRVSIEPAYGALHTGGTVARHDTLWTLRPSDDRADRPGIRPNVRDEHER